MLGPLAHFAVNLPGTHLLGLLLEGIEDGPTLRRRKRAFAPAPDADRIFTVDGRRVAPILSRVFTVGLHFRGFSSF